MRINIKVQLARLKSCMASPRNLDTNKKYCFWVKQNKTNKQKTNNKKIKLIKKARKMGVCVLFKQSRIQMTIKKLNSLDNTLEFIQVKLQLFSVLGVIEDK